MTIKQTFNKKINAWVKYQHKKGKGAKILDVKESNPKKPFKGVPKV